MSTPTKIVLALIGAAVIAGGVVAYLTLGRNDTQRTATRDSEPSGDEDPTPIDLASIDACSFFDVATIQQITGETVRFANQGRADVSLSNCFWGAAEPGVPAYVELSLSRYRGDIAGGVKPDCTVSAVDMEGVDAAGATCPPDPQRKIYLLAGDRGIKVSLLVNEPTRQLTPKDLVPFVESVVATL